MSVTHNPKFLEYCRAYKRKYKLLNWYHTALYLLNHDTKEIKND